MARLWIPRVSPRRKHKFHGGSFSLARKHGTPVEGRSAAAAAAASWLHDSDRSAAQATAGQTDRQTETDKREDMAIA